MKKLLNIFHYLSLLQYPFVLLGGYYVYKAIFELGDNLWGDLNLCFTFLGVALSFLGLADTSKNIERSKKITGKGKLIKGILIYILVLIISFFSVGFYALSLGDEEPIKELAMGMIIFGIGLLGLLKMNIEIVKNHLK